MFIFCDLRNDVINGLYGYLHFSSLSAFFAISNFGFAISTIFFPKSCGKPAYFELKVPEQKSLSF